MWPFRQKSPPTLSEEFVTRYWDLSARVDSLEQRLDDALGDLKRRAASVAQAERRKAARDQLELSVDPDIQPDNEVERVRRLTHGPA